MIGDTVHDIDRLPESSQGVISDVRDNQYKKKEPADGNENDQPGFVIDEWFWFHQDSI